MRTTAGRWEDFEAFMLSYIGIQIVRPIIQSAPSFPSSRIVTRNPSRHSHNLILCIYFGPLARPIQKYAAVTTWVKAAFIPRMNACVGLGLP